MDDVKVEINSQQDEKSVLEFASAWSIMTFSFMYNILKTGSRRPLQLDDLDALPSSDHIHKLKIEAIAQIII